MTVGCSEWTEEMKMRSNLLVLFLQVVEALINVAFFAFEKLFF